MNKEIEGSVCGFDSIIAEPDWTIEIRVPAGSISKWRIGDTVTLINGEIDGPYIAASD